MKPLYEFSAEQQQRFIEGHLNQGRVISRTEGSFGEIFFLEGMGRRIAAKCPNISRFGNPDDARSALGKAIYEIENTRKYLRYPGVHRLAPPRLVLGWPFFLSKMRDGTLRDLIAEPSAWNHLDKLAILIQVTHTLNYCRSLGLSAHQDLKPDNVLVERIPSERMNGIDRDAVVGLTTITYVSDFGMADAFRNIGKNQGSRPYMSPEQYGTSLLVDGSKIDVFALGVIAFECFTDGLHPIGEHTFEVWPRQAPGKSPRWKHEDVWKNWARRSVKDLTPLAMISDLPQRLRRLVEACLAPDPTARPSMEETENELWLSLTEISLDWSIGVRTQIETNFDRYAPPAEELEWPYMDQCIDELRRFYSQAGR